MATKTPNLQLIKPAKGEYFNNWHTPMNLNWDVVDEVVGGISDEVTEARGTEATLNDRLNTGLEPNGTLKPTTEFLAARSSTIYGSDDGTTDYTLDVRLEQSEVEIFYARQQKAKLLDSLAWAEDGNSQNAVISAATNFLTFSGAVVTCNGAVTALEANINGYRQVVRTNKTVTISGAAATYYLYLQRASSGETIYTIPATSGAATTYTPTTKLSKLTAAGANFVTAGVKPGDIFRVTGPISNPNIGDYVVHSTNVEDPTNLNPNELRIIGEFATTSTGLDGIVINPIAPTLGFTATAHSKTFSRVAGKIFIGRCVFDGANVTSVTIYALKGIYDAFTNVASLPLSATIAHNLGYVPSKITFYASQANDFSQPIEMLSVAEMSAGAASITTGSISTTNAIVNFSAGLTTLTPNTPQVLSFTAPTLSYTDQVVNYTAPVLTYTAPVLRRSVIARMSDTTVEVKNATTGLFYRDFSGADQTTGFLRIVCER